MSTTEPKPALYALHPDEHATVLAALRYYQHELGNHASYAHYEAIRVIASGDESWPRLTAKQIDRVCEGLNHPGLDIGEVVNILGADSNDPYAAGAQEKNMSDRVSFDGNPVVSLGEGGAQVMAWVWVSDDDAGLNTYWTIQLDAEIPDGTWVKPGDSIPDEPFWYFGTEEEFKQAEAYAQQLGFKYKTETTDHLPDDVEGIDDVDSFKEHANERAAQRERY